MIIILKTNPYGNENIFGALFIALSAAKSGERIEVIFVEKALLNLLKNESEICGLKLPIISDIILQLVGSVHFYFVPTNEKSSFFSPQNFNLHRISGIKEIDYEALCNKIIENGKNLLIL